MSLFRNRTTGIGVDLGTSTLKVVELTEDKGNIALASYAIAQQPNVLVESGRTDAVGQMAVILREVFNRASISRGQVYAALPILSVFSTVLELPAMPDRDLESAVTFAARSYVPSLLTDVVLGWTPVGEPREAGGTQRAAATPAVPVGPGNAPAPPPGAPPPPVRAAVTPAPAPPPTAAPGSSPTLTVEHLRPPPATEQRVPIKRPQTRKIQEIFLTAAPRDLVDRYTQLFERLDIEIAALEVESFPLARSLLQGETRPAMIIDFGDCTTSFSVVDEGYLRVNQAVDMGGDSLTKAITEKLSISYEEAEERKRTEGLGGRDASGPVAAAMRPILSELIERGETLRRLYERKRARTIGRIILIGGGALLPGLSPFWNQATGLPAEVGNPWRGVGVPSALTDVLRDLGPAFAVAVGLALRPFET